MGIWIRPPIFRKFALPSQPPSSNRMSSTTTGRILFSLRPTTADAATAANPAAAIAPSDWKTNVSDRVNALGRVESLKAQGIDILDLANSQCIAMIGNFQREHPDLWNECVGEG